MRNSLKVLLAAVVLGLGLSMRSEAALARGAKQVQSMQNSTTGIAVSSTSAVVYSVTLSTGTGGTDYVVLFDSNAITGLNAITQSTAVGYKLRINVSSTTQNTVVIFDPPLQFNNGLVAFNSTGVITSMITWEKGRIVTGY